MRYLFYIILALALNVSCKSGKGVRGSGGNSEWNLVFHDDGTSDYKKHWSLDGRLATIEHSKKGMHFKAGPEAWNDAHHAVLWTKDSFSGDVKIEFDYTKTDHENRFVNILYIQATGDGEGVHERDITKWKKKREVPAMREYFENMNVFHISYAAFGNSGDGTYYIRARRYPKLDGKPFKQTLLEPSYDDQGLFETGKTYHITAIKNEEQLFFKIESEDDQSTFTWDIQEVEPIEHGRIGIRHMYTRSAIYKNIKIYTKK